MIRTELCDLLDIKYPIVQAAMGVRVPLAAAVSEAGGLGMISIDSGMAGEREARETFDNAFEFLTRETDAPFGVNVMAGSSKMSELPSEVKETLDAYLEEALVSKLTDEKVNNQLKLIETSAGNPERWIDKINDVKADTDLVHFHKVASVKHAKKVERLGVDGITASGFEMAGHTHKEEDAISSFVLLPAVTEAVEVPVLASGGVRNGRGLYGALAMGGAGVYMGTRLIATQEADFHENYKQYLVESEPGGDTLMEGFFGPLRVLESPGLDQLEEAKPDLDIRSISALKEEKMTNAMQGNIDEGIVLAGQVAGFIDDVPTVEELLERMMKKAAEAHQQIERVDVPV